MARASTTHPGQARTVASAPCWAGSRNAASSSEVDAFTAPWARAPAQTVPVLSLTHASRVPISTVLSTIRGMLTGLVVP